jgi:aryl-alcohol dehydrogenase-like predicted oxidoreductase
LDEYWQTLLDLKKEGKIRAAGLSNHTVQQLEEAEKLGHVDSLQPPFSAIRRDVGGAEVPWCHTHHTGIIVYSPMQAGLLSGRFTRERAAGLPKDDWRSRSVEFQGEKLDQNLALADAFRSVADRHTVSVAAASVAWTLAWPGVSGAIVGARTPEQVDGWLAAASLHLNDHDMQYIAEAIHTTGAGVGPSLPIKGIRQD